jgi:hypothetical protein
MRQNFSQELYCSIKFAYHLFKCNANVYFDASCCIHWSDLSEMTAILDLFHCFGVRGSVDLASRWALGLDPLNINLSYRTAKISQNIQYFLSCPIEQLPKNKPEYFFIRQTNTNIFDQFNKLVLLHFWGFLKWFIWKAF